MGSPLGPILANFFKVEVENTVIQRLENKVKILKRYVDDTIFFAKVDSTNLLLTTLNSFQSDIKFNSEIEKDSAIPFLADLVIKTPKRIHTTVYLRFYQVDMF